MRKIINISLPEEIAKKVKSRAKTAGFRSVSGYFKSLVEMDQNLISEDELLEMVKEADREYKKGTLKECKSLYDLIKE